MVNLLHSLFSVWVDLYLTIRCLFSCWGELPAKGIPPVVDIPHEAFAGWRSVHAVMQVDHITHLGRISPPDWQTITCKSLTKMAGLEYLDLACRGLTFVPPDCASWLLDMEEDGPLNILSASKGLLPMLTVSA